MWTKSVLICTHKEQNNVIDGIPLAEMKSVLGVQDHENVTDHSESTSLNDRGRPKFGHLQGILSNSTLKLMSSRLPEGSAADRDAQGILMSIFPLNTPISEVFAAAKSSKPEECINHVQQSSVIARQCSQSSRMLQIKTVADGHNSGSEIRDSITVPLQIDLEGGLTLPPN